MGSLVILDHLIVGGSRFLVSVLVARLLGLDDFGVYTLLWTIVTFASSLQVPVTITPMMQLGATMSERRGAEFFAASLALQVAYNVVAVPLVSIACLPILWRRPDMVSVVIAVNVYVVAFNQYEFFRRFFYAVGRKHLVLLLDATLYAVVLAITFGLLASGKATIGAYLLLSAAPAAAFSIVVACLLPLEFSRRQRLLLHARSMLRLSGPLLVSTIAGFVSGHVFVYATALFLGASEVGGFAAARNVTGPLTILLMALENGMTREAVLRNAASRESLHAYVRKTTAVWLAAFAMYSAVAWFFGEWFLLRVYGEEFARFNHVVLWLCVASLLQLVSRTQAVRLRTENDYGAIKGANLAAMWISLVVSVPLVYMFGLNGAVLSIFCQQIAVLIFQRLPVRLDSKLGLVPLSIRQMGE